MIRLKKLGLAGACASVLMGGALPVYAANWLMLQGTEPAGTAARARLWGFIQPTYESDTSDPNAAGQFVPPKLIPPNLTTQKAFNLRRARIGVRGTALPLDSNVNYFLLAELGNNGITAKQGSSVKATDASVTFNHLPGARIRTGLFKYPGAEEGLQAIHVFDYINFTEITNGVLLERFPNATFAGNVPPQTIPPATPFNAFDRPVGAFRDVGVQVFDAFTSGDWETSYAVMMGNGNGLQFSDVNNDKDIYLYLSTEKVYGGKGPRREGLKFFVWSQSGKRTFDGNNDGTPEEYDRDRNGFGAKYLKKPWRVTTEFINAEGVIWVGPDKPSFGFLPPAVGNPNHTSNGLKAEADGWYIEGGWYIPGTKWELDLRYDEMDRLKGAQAEHTFEKITYGAQYHVNRKTRITINVEDRDFKANNFASGAGPNANLDGVDTRYSIQATMIF
jgi:hypothetical protein